MVRPGRNSVMLMPSLYQVYAAVLAGSLEEDLERKRILSETQAGFKKGMGTLDQTYALNYIINWQIGRKAGKLTAVFIDLKAAFDSVDKKVLIEAMRERGVREGLVRNIEEILGETMSRVRVRGQIGEEFWRQREKSRVVH